MFFKIGSLTNLAILRIEKRLRHRCFLVKSIDVKLKLIDFLLKMVG